MADNSTDDTVPVDIDDLDTFSANFFGTNPVEAKELEISENEDDTLATERDSDNAESEDNSEQGEPKESEAEAPEAKPEDTKGKKKRNSFQERIDELNTRAYSAERERDALRLEMENLKARSEVAPKEPETLREKLPPEAPKPDAVDDNGDAVYALGEFDPLFIRDLTKFTIEQETKAAKAEAEKEVQEREFRAAQEELNKSWNDKVEKVVEELPDYREKITSLGSAFKGIDQQYGDYLATTIMQCDNGPEIMYYLSQNIGEAQTIVASGPVAATLAIGRLQSRFEKPIEEKSNPKKVTVSEAPSPPEVQTRGRGGRFAVRPDTDDLDAFEREFFN